MDKFDKTYESPQEFFKKYMDMKNNEYEDFDQKQFQKKMDAIERELEKMMMDKDYEQYDKYKKLKKDKEFRKKKIEAKRKKAPDMTDKTRYYTGVGARETPDYVCDLMTEIAKKFREDGYRLRSGHAYGADLAFEQGAGPAADIYLPWPSFNENIDFTGEYDEQKQMIVKPSVLVAPTEEAISIAAAYHPNWAACDAPVRSLHGRNVHQVLGGLPAGRPNKSDCLICWTPDGKASGGTGQAMRIAEKASISIWNLHDEDTFDMAFEWVWGDGELSAT